MPTQAEHRIKYQESRKILDTLFDKTNKEHSNWITTISFYTALHIVEYEFAKNSVDCKNHADREAKMQDSEIFSKKISEMYKQMGTNSRVARYQANNITPTIAEQMLRYLGLIEKEFDFPKT
jgi:hypothetical protein